MKFDDLHIEPVELPEPRNQNSYTLLEILGVTVLAVIVIMMAQGMIHSYSGSFEQAEKLIDLGFYISFGGAITYTNAKKLRSTASKLPLSSILLETDAPDQPDASHHGERNQPAYLVNVLKCLAELREESIEEIAAQTTFNARKLFQI